MGKFVIIDVDEDGRVLAIGPYKNKRDASKDLEKLVDKEYGKDSWGKLEVFNDTNGLMVGVEHLYKEAHIWVRETSPLKGIITKMKMGEE